MGNSPYYNFPCHNFPCYSSLEEVDSVRSENLSSFQWRTGQTFFCFFLCLLLLSPIAEAFAAKPKAAEKNQADAECRAHLLMNVDTGDVVEESNAHEPLPPASMVKLMTTYVTLKRIAEGSVKADDVVTVSRESSKIGGSQVYLREGEQFPLSDLLQAVLIQSANDAANAIAEYIGGTRDGFVAMMNAEAKQLGMTESEFHSPHGLPPGKDQQPDVVSAHDFSVLARALITQYPQVLKYTSLTECDFRGGEFKMSNHNHLLRSFPGCDGLKTGYYAQAGFSITATAERNGSRMLAVVMGCPQRKERDKEAARLLSLGFAQYHPTALIDKGIPVEVAVPIADGNPSSVRPVTNDALKVSLKSGQEADVVKKVEACNGLTAPVSAETPCGYMVFSLGEHELGRVPLVIPQPIPRAGLVDRLRQKIGW
jgi:D-alanyl-D-alanine carboxypeptidase (penicillin-binding protein 5/6)